MSSTRNIAKNSLFLYIRMFLNMGVALFTAGIVLNTLGIKDYGIYNIVGGFVSLFGFLNSSMSSATQRFLSFDIGKNDFIQLKKTFSTTVTIHFGIAIIIVMALETFGLWYINHKLNVPADRMTAVNIVFQFSVLSFFFGIIQVPYNALITAHERFNVYAYISFVEIAFKLLILFFLTHLEYDKLVLYSILLFTSSFIIRMIYRIYCRRNFPESRYSFYFDKAYFKTLLSFTGWNLFGYVSVVAKNQGVNLLLNAFFGIVINAAYGITMQVQGIVLNFVTSFQSAVNPQIVKNYASGNIERSIKLMQQSAKLSFGLMLIIAFPILISLENILNIWLKTYPAETIIFVHLAFINILAETMSHPIAFVIDATGKIKNYQIVSGFLFFINLPVSYITLKIFNTPQVTFIVSIFVTFLVLITRLYFLKLLVNINLTIFTKKVIVPVVVLSIISLIAYYSNQNLNFGMNIYVELVAKSTLSILFISSSSFLILLTKEERRLIKGLMSNKLKKILM